MAFHVSASFLVISAKAASGLRRCTSSRFAWGHSGPLSPHQATLSLENSILLSILYNGHCRVESTVKPLSSRLITQQSPVASQCKSSVSGGTE
eukprot:1069894-Prorocentrum_minimum.AAC.1